MNPGDSIWKDPDTGAYWHLPSCEYGGKDRMQLEDPEAFYRDVLDFVLTPEVVRSRCLPDGSVVHDVVEYTAPAWDKRDYGAGAGAGAGTHNRLRLLRRAFKAWGAALVPAAPPDLVAPPPAPVVATKRGRPRTRFPSYAREPTAFNLFVRSVMPQVKEALPQANNRERMARCAELWRLRAPEINNLPND